MTVTEIKARIAFRTKALDKLYEAYLALVEGGVKSYTIDDRTLTRFDINGLKDEIDAIEKEIDDLNALLNGKRPRKAFGIVPRDW
ncbi:hypothetical protein EI53_01900 [Fusobacterium naviforme]|nr:hypothetical protein F7P78_06755 [Fusobacterium naviforme]PSL09116.1 hypothetical protein EI53_01900 [Fusobacterium naviforme]STO27700.1 Uncharacterised protein [Fusobacterium naviforme]